MTNASTTPPPTDAPASIQPERTLLQGQVSYSVTELPDGTIRLHFDQTDLNKAIALSISSEHFRQLDGLIGSSEQKKKQFTQEERARIKTAKHYLEKAAFAFFQKAIVPLLPVREQPETAPVSVTEEKVAADPTPPVSDAPNETIK